ncbi:MULTISPECIES: hypothetical protein [Pseudomonas]|jgi:hypothetical protein|uniref:hypothetical protein n=1 Tax=Pseudomonas TaxID=286 RepID=UPI0018E867CA|nr:MULTISPECIES: hypothetical protein [Pseudomonas]MBJ2286766.1 hypothetical protein [Pseudomonas sp. MF6755]MDH0796048.1 hypothetical protein [Pseudomonas carnis]
MQVMASTIQKVEISEIKALDPVTCILQDLGRYSGSITVSCAGRSWMRQWNNTGANSIAEYIGWQDAEYLACALAPMISATVYDESMLVAYAKKVVLERRLGKSLDYDSLDKEDARRLYNACDSLRGYVTFESLPSALMTDLFGDEWFYAAGHAQGPNPSFEYVKRISQAVIDGMAHLRPAHAAKNRFGLDMDYFKRRLNRLIRDLADFPPDEAARELARMARTADHSVLAEVEFIQGNCNPHVHPCLYQVGERHCNGGGFLTDPNHTVVSLEHEKPCPRCNTMLWLMDAKNEVGTLAASGADGQAIERIWLDALGIAYREAPERVLAALEAIGVVDVPVRASVDEGVLIRRYNAPEAYADTKFDENAINEFSIQLKVKMARSRAKGRDGWFRKDLCSASTLSQMLREHVDKGDPIDTGILSMMLQQRGESIELEQVACEA